MPNQQREIFHGESGDRWLLSRDDGGHTVVVHQANNRCKVYQETFWEEERLDPSIKRLLV